MPVLTSPPNSGLLKAKGNAPEPRCPGFLAGTLAPAIRATAVSQRTCLLSLCVALAALAGPGCRQGQLYKAGSLPREFMAPRTASLQNVDLSCLARATGNNAVIYPGDVVEITIATGVEQEKPLGTKVRVGENGNVTVPLVGTVQIAGLEFNQAEQLIRTESIRRGQFVDPNVTVILDSRKSNRVTVVGAVEKPGTYELPSSSTDVLGAIVHAGGLSKDAGTIIELRHPAMADPAATAQRGPDGNVVLTAYNGAQPQVAPPKTEQIDLEKAHGGENLVVEDGATVMVMKRPKRFIHVIGLVKKADQFEMPDDQELRLLDAVALAGGRTIEIADKVHIVRQLPDRVEPVVIEASFREAKQDGTANIRLAAGDVVSVEETPLTFVVGTVRDFVRFGFSAAIPGF